MSKFNKERIRRDHYGGSKEKPSVKIWQFPKEVTESVK